MPYSKDISQINRNKQIQLIKYLFNNDMPKDIIKYTLGGVPHAHDDVGYPFSKKLGEHLETIYPNGKKGKRSSIFTSDGCVKHLSKSGEYAVHEHPIPVEVCFQHLIDKKALKGQLTDEDVAEVVDCIKEVVVSKEEDDRLNAADLKKTMPAGWKFGDDPLARYKIVGIELVNFK